ncbi:hypothetical protein NC652_019657 [Populus alba x Populus x berolinensis]|nr:hypothetical protein NC652_019657 [Populus alba x Populus x berolinensis]
MDPGSFKSFDEDYYTIVAKRRGLFQSDSALLDDAETRDYVRFQSRTQGSTFAQDFAESMVKMGYIGVLTGKQGEIRKRCAVIMAIQKLFSVLFLHLALAFLLAELTNAGGLQLGFYRRACPDAELIVHETLHRYISRDPTLAAPLLRICPNAERIVQDYVNRHIHNAPSLAAAIIRMHFHDCFVRGCDASGGPFWRVPTGRRDGTISRSSEALNNIPPPTSNFTNLQRLFANQGLDLKDLVLLSEMDPGSFRTFDLSYYSLLLKRRGLFQSDSALTTNSATLSFVNQLLQGPRQNFFGEFANSMEKMGRVNVKTGTTGEIRKHCAFGGPFWRVPTGRRDGTISRSSEALNNIPPPTSNFTNLQRLFANQGLDLKDLVLLSEMDPGSFRTFDLSYYSLLLKRRGLFQSDSALTTNSATLSFVNQLLQGPLQNFFGEFANSMEKMGRVNVKTGTTGEIRKHCAFSSVTLSAAFYTDSYFHIHNSSDVRFFS